MKIIKQEAPCNCREHRGQKVTFGLTFTIDHEGEIPILDAMLAEVEAGMQAAGIKRRETRIEMPSVAEMVKTANQN